MARGLLVHTSRNALLAVFASTITLFTAGCPFGPPIPVEENPNYPPFIDDKDVTPTSFLVSVRRNEEVTLEVKRFLDGNDGEELDILWQAPAAGAGLVLKSQVVLRNSTVPEPIDELFYVYEGSRYVLNPCEILWRNKPELSVSVLASDGRIPNTEEFVSAEGQYLTSYTWTIVFEGECPE